MSAEYVMTNGNREVILCERGIRTFEPQVAHILDVAAIVLARQQSHYPVIADTYHASGRPDLVVPLACAAVAGGADGLMVEIHPRPQEALSDAGRPLLLSSSERCCAKSKRASCCQKP